MYTYFICLYRLSARELETFFFDDRFRFILFSLFAIIKENLNWLLKIKIHCRKFENHDTEISKKLADYKSQRILQKEWLVV